MARFESLDLDSTCFYHCMVRCVRRAFLCGRDEYSGRDFEHRKVWVRERLRDLSAVYAMDVCAYAVMSNHVHVVLHVAVERAEDWSDDEVVARYGSLFPVARSDYLALSSARARKERREVWRERLCSVSWMMRSLNEYIAKRANKEDGVRGRFWEGRFKCQPLLDERGLLTCMAYVDLNPVRANMTSSLEGSDFTSVQERLMDLARKKSQHRRQTAPETLAPFADQEPSGESEEEIPMDFDADVELLEWTMEGLAAEKRKRRTLASRPPNVLLTMGLDPAAWLAAVEERKLGNASFLGAPRCADEAATARNKQWLRGIGLARALAA